MNRKILLSVFICLCFAAPAFAGGLLMPNSQNYPKDFLRLLNTEITVNINGTVAETIVHEEFINEWYDSTNAVYSFPLPPDARATEFLYWYNDTLYTAVLQVKEQAVNPGTGEGGVAALVNNYIGRNGIKVFLKGIAPGMIQKIELHYLSRCDYYMGKYSYNFPLGTGDFITYPINNLKININVESSADISKYGLPSFPGYSAVASGGKKLSLTYSQPKAYLDKDFQFYYEIENPDLAVDFYSAANDSEDGHFALFLRPSNDAAQDSVFPKRIFFLLSNSADMTGNKFMQSVEAISQAITQLSPRDYFNIVTFNYYAQPWMSGAVVADSVNKSSALQMLTSLATTSGSNMGAGLRECFNEIKDDSFNNCILVFTTGRTLLVPRDIENLNIHKTGIFSIGIGDNLDRARLEMTAALNYGFVTYIDESDNLTGKMMRVFNQINQPVMKDVSIEFGGAGISQVSPSKIPSAYAGSLLYLTGRYGNPGNSALSIGGRSISGMTAYDFKLNFSASDSAYRFVRYLWAKEMIDDIERQIEVYGETDSLKQKDIELSLKYNIRCRYTAYIADYSTTPPTTGTGVETTRQPLVPDSYIAGNYPNPFNPSTTFRIYIDKLSAGKVKLLRVYNILGQLVAVIDISSFREGWHNVLFSGRDFYGASLPSGIYFVRLQIGNNIANTLKINLLK